MRWWKIHRHSYAPTGRYYIASMAWGKKLTPEQECKCGKKAPHGND